MYTLIVQIVIRQIHLLLFLDHELKNHSQSPPFQIIVSLLQSTHASQVTCLLLKNTPSVLTPDA
jgi:hypothetical protein